MPSGNHRLTAADRARLCDTVDLAAMMQADGVDVRRNGRAYLARLRPDERTASCHVYPPGVGKRGADGWTWWDYGPGRGGDALAYLVDVRGCPLPMPWPKCAAWPEGRPPIRPIRPLPKTTAPFATPPLIIPPSALIFPVDPILRLHPQAKRRRFFDQEQVKAAGGHWHPEAVAWSLPDVCWKAIFPALLRNRKVSRCRCIVAIHVYALYACIYRYMLLSDAY